MNRENIQIWIDVLKRVDERVYNFDIRKWSSADEPKENEAEHHQCGTVACAAGWLAVSKEFIDLGGSSYYWYGVPIFKKKHGIGAIVEFTGLDFSSARNIVGFGKDCINFYGKNASDVTAKDVIAKLQELLDGDEDGN